MNYQIRTNETRHISQLIAPALLPFNVLNGKNDISPADGSITATTQKHSAFQVEEGGPVRPAERVPYSSSHYFVSLVSAMEHLASEAATSEQLAREKSASSRASFCPGTTDTDQEVAAA
jgi:hypothetical protein